MNFLSLILSANVLISWTGVPEATGYKIYAGKESGKYEPMVWVVPNIESVSLHDLPDDLRFFAVSTMVNELESPKSVEAVLPAAPVPTPSPTPVQTPPCDPTVLAQCESNYKHCETNNFQMYNAWQDSLRVQAKLTAAKIAVEKELAICKKKYPKGCR